MCQEGAEHLPHGMASVVPDQTAIPGPKKPRGLAGAADPKAIEATIGGDEPEAVRSAPEPKDIERARSLVQELEALVKEANTEMVTWKAEFVHNIVLSDLTGKVVISLLALDAAKKSVETEPRFNIKTVEDEIRSLSDALTSTRALTTQALETKRQLEAAARTAAEAERVEAERAAAERVEAERVEAERAAAARVEAERVEAERVEAERVEAERVEAERVEAARVAAEAAPTIETPTVSVPFAVVGGASATHAETLATTPDVTAAPVAAAVEETAKSIVEETPAERALTVIVNHMDVDGTDLHAMADAIRAIAATLKLKLPDVGDNKLVKQYDRKRMKKACLDAIVGAGFAETDAADYLPAFLKN